MVGGDIPFAEENGLGHIMSSDSLHKTTIDLDTGAIIHEFGYDENNNLIYITDQFGNQTTINRNGNGVPTSITSLDGLTTQLTIEADNHLTRITYPEGSFYSFEYTPDGLMTAKIEPEANRFEHVFDSNGKLTDAIDQEGGHWQFSRTASANGDILTEVLTGEGNLTSYLDYTYSTGAYTSTINDPTGSQALFSESGDGLTVNKTLPCGMDLEFKYGLDSEYKFKFVKEMMETTPSALEKVTLRDKTYQDTDTDDIPDLITETVTVNGKSTTFENNVLKSQKTVTSPEGRTITMLYDPSTLVTESMNIPGLFDTAYGYDTRGRLTSVDTNTRGTDLTYNAQGFLESITDPENYITSYSYDAVGRMTGINRPDGSSIGLTYNKKGNMTVLTNPSNINHGFGYNKVNLNNAYQTPLNGSYSYVYDKDRRLKQTNFPSGNQIKNIYDTTRLSQIQTPEGNIDFAYLCSTKVGSITKGSESITYGYDGKLVTFETLSGTLNQTFGYTYNDDFDLTCFTYASNTVNYTYDNDRLLTGAGSFAITRNAQNGLPESVTGGSLNLSRSFNGYGEIDGQDFTINSQNSTSWNLIRDNNGSITNKSETVGSTSSDYIYTYDAMGRLRTVTKNSTLIEEYQYDANGTRITDQMSPLMTIPLVGSF
jgi:YD repeat-containing protein